MALSDRCKPQRAFSAACWVGVMVTASVLVPQRLRAQPAPRHQQSRLAQSSDAGRAPVATSTSDAGSTPVTVTTVEVMVLVGSNGTGGIAANLRALRQLTRPPFSAYHQIDRVSESTHRLSVRTPATVGIPNGGTLQLVLLPEPRGERSVVVVNISLGGRTHQTQFTARPGVPFFLAHSTGVGGALILRFVLN